MSFNTRSFTDCKAECIQHGTRGPQGKRAGTGGRPRRGMSSRKEGRADLQAWAEAGRWMGHSPPIPVDPVQSVPDAVLRHTPGPAQYTALDPMLAQSGSAPTPMPQFQPQATQSMGQPAHVPAAHSAQRQTPTPPTHGVQQPPPGRQPGWNTQTSGPGDHQPGHQIHGTGFGAEHLQQGPAIPQATTQAHVGHVNQPYLSSGPQAPTGEYGQQTDQRPVPTPSRRGQGLPPQGAPHPSRSNHHSLQHAKSQGPAARTHTSHTHPRQQDSHRRSQSLTVPPRADTTDSYLDRVEHDPRLRSMLSGAPTRTIHTPVPMTGSSANTGTDKPLPHPSGGKSKRSASQRHSLMDGLHGQHATAHISTGDRYPTFPKNGRGHSRQSSFGSADPARRNNDS